MRVISGKNRGTKLIAPTGFTTRPTDDRLKENIFNLIGPIERGSNVLDLFAGSGQIGIEFLSRGAKHCYFIDKNYKAIKAIEDNLAKTRNTENATIIKGDVISMIDTLREKFSYIYIDPPYDDTKIIERLFKIIQLSDIIDSSTWIIFETLKDFVLHDANIIKERVYGKRKIIIAEVL